MPSLPAPEIATNQGDRRASIDQLHKASQVPLKQRETSLADVARVVTAGAYEHGLSEESLERVIDMITLPNNLDQATLISLTKNLYPSGKVSSSVVSKVVACLGPSKVKPSASTQALLVRWLVLVYNVLEDSSHLSKFYGVLFSHLDMISLRRPLCHILTLMTRRRHVKPFRIHALMDLANEAGDSDRELLCLLKTYKNYYSDIVSGDGGRSTFFFKHPDPEWGEHLRVVQERTIAGLLHSDPTEISFKVVRKGAKRSRVDVLPEIQTSRVNEGSTTLEEIGTLQEFVEKFEKLEMPNQAVSLLSDPLAQKYLMLHPSDTNRKRMQHWLEAFLADASEKAVKGDAEAEESLELVLESVLDFTKLTKTLPASTERFLRRYLAAWDGHDADVLLPLLTFLPMMPFPSLLKDYLHPVEVALLSHETQSKAKVLDFYVTLIRRWTSWILVANPDAQVSTDQSSAQWTGGVLGDLVSHAELLAFTMLETSNPPNSSAHAAVLNFYTTLAHIFACAPRYRSIRLNVPPAPTIYNIAFTPIIAFIAPLCSVLATYKSAFEESITSQSDVHIALEPYTGESVSKFNGYVMDLCNLLWRSRALNSSDPNALACLVEPSTVASLQKYIQAHGQDRVLGPTFGFSGHPALSSISASYFRQAEVDAGISGDQQLRGPVTQKKLVTLGRNGGLDMTWQDYRLNMLEWLDGLGMSGIGDLMRRTMKLLRDGKQSQ